MLLSNEGPTLETKHFTIRTIGSTPIFIYFDLYLNTAYAAHYILVFFDEEPTLKTLDFTFYIGSTSMFLNFGLYLNTAYATHYVYFIIWL